MSISYRLSTKKWELRVKTAMTTHMQDRKGGKNISLSCGERLLFHCCLWVQRNCFLVITPVGPIIGLVAIMLRTDCTK